MINEERVREMAQLAAMDQGETRQTRQMKEYFGSDYVAKEMLISLFTGTLAFGLILLLGFLAAGEDAIDTISSVASADFLGTGKQFLFLYLAFEALYLLITAMVYRGRYHENRLEQKKYVRHLKKLNKLYEREEKIKA